MILADYFYDQPDESWEIARLCGVRHGVLRLPETPDFDIADKSHWQTVIDRLLGYGVKPVVIEPLPNCIHDHIKLGDSQRDESIEKAIQMLAVMDELDIHTLCFNFMAGVGWTRTSGDLPERGGATVTGFDLAAYQAPDVSITEEALWENYRFFIEALAPHAQKHGIRLAMHPDDPPISPLGHVSRIMISCANIEKALALAGPDALGITLCQATYHLMGEDLFTVVPRLRDRIFFIHFRNVIGTKEHFRETFHDNGDLPMARLIRLYKDLGIDVPIRVDHVPTLPGEINTRHHGYAARARLFAIGYLKGLLEEN